MRVFDRRNISIILAGRLVFAMSCTAGLAQEAVAASFDAAKVMNEMNNDQRTGYISGVVEGLAVARYMKDGKTSTGMNCIYGWFYDDKGTLKAIFEAFDKYPTYPPGVLVDILAKQKCEE